MDSIGHPVEDEEELPVTFWTKWSERWDEQYFTSQDHFFSHNATASENRCAASSVVRGKGNYSTITRWCQRVVFI